MSYVVHETPDDKISSLYKRLCDMHMGVMLTHGGQVAAGLALAIKEVHDLLPKDPDPDHARSCGCGGTGIHGVDHGDWP
jgi:hypothetical protein